MILLVAIITIIVIAVFFAKKIFLKVLQYQYEKSLIKGDKKKSVHLGKIYYLSIDDAKRKAKGIVDIERKISDDFRSFNNASF